jgi:23S rRNA (cytidine1920-2'-O)/16S rRNA (cytidine1409-2'-O)-methyltransferase
VNFKSAIPVSKERLDKILVDKGLVQSRERARALILAGAVLVDDVVVDKAGTKVPVSADFRIRGEDIPFVSRGGLKLQKALEVFPISIENRIIIDVGASTGGFTDCLLQNGACRVYSVDVGYGQLAWSLRSDDRVVNMERTNIRTLTPERLDQVPNMAVIDASFISLEKVLPPTLELLQKPAEIIALIKPQFEVGKGEVGKGGVVRDESLHDKVKLRITKFSEALGCEVGGIAESPITGPKGNREFLLFLRCKT